MKKTIRALLPLLVVTLAAGPALADKLVVFKNGKVLRAQGVTSEGQWTYADLGKGATVGVRTADILRIEESAGGGKKTEGYNMAATDNRGVSRSGGGRADRRSSTDIDRSASVQERIEQRQRELEQQRESQQNADRGRSGNLRGAPAGMRQVTQPFNQRSSRTPSGLRRSRLGSGLGQRTVSDQRLDTSSANDGDDN